MLAKRALASKLAFCPCDPCYGEETFLLMHPSRKAARDLSRVAEGSYSCRRSRQAFRCPHVPAQGDEGKREVPGAGIGGFAGLTERGVVRAEAGFGILGLVGLGAICGVPRGSGFFVIFDPAIEMKGVQTPVLARVSREALGSVLCLLCSCAYAASRADFR